MFRTIVAITATLTAALWLSSCSKEIEYNSNSGYDGSRDSASQLLVNTSKVDDVSAPDGDNEDWFYFMPPSDGLVTVRTHIDSPNGFVGTISVLDGFGRQLYALNTNDSQQIYEFLEFEVKPERYFISIITSQGKTSYTVRADFREPPPPEPPIEIIPEDPTPSSSSSRSSCVPADKCKSGQKCCRQKTPQTTDEGIAEGEKTIVGTIVLVTPQNGDTSDIKISGLGTSKGVKKGAKAYLRGLKRKVDIYSCMTTSCQATVKATSEELLQYDKVDVVVN